MSDSKDDDAEFKATVKRMLATPPTPHKPTRSNQEQKKTVKVESDRKPRSVDSVERKRTPPKRGQGI